MGEGCAGPRKAEHAFAPSFAGELVGLFTRGRGALLQPPGSKRRRLSRATWCSWAGEIAGPRGRQPLPGFGVMIRPTLALPRAPAEAEAGRLNARSPVQDSSSDQRICRHQDTRNSKFYRLFDGRIFFRAALANASRSRITSFLMLPKTVNPLLYRGPLAIDEFLGLRGFLTSATGRSSSSGRPVGVFKSKEEVFWLTLATKVIIVFDGASRLAFHSDEIVPKNKTKLLSGDGLRTRQKLGPHPFMKNCDRLGLMSLCD